MQHESWYRVRQDIEQQQSRCGRDQMQRRKYCIVSSLSVQHSENCTIMRDQKY